MSDWKISRVFYQTPEEEKKRNIFSTPPVFMGEVDSNDYIKHLKSKLSTLSFAAPFGSIGLLACKHIYALIRERQPDLIIETNIGHGVTSTYILAALQKNGKGKLISIDKGTNVGQLVIKGLRLNWEPKVGKSSDILPTINQPIDMFLHDSLHTYKNMLFEFEWAFSKLKPNGLLFSHDIGTNNSFYDFAKTVNHTVSYLPTTKNRYGVGVIQK